LVVGTAEKILKSRMLNGALWCYLFMPDPPTSTFLLLFSHLKVIYILAFNSKVYSNKYATLRACHWLWISLVIYRWRIPCL